MLWHIEKLFLAKIKWRLEAFSLPTDSTKRVLSRQLHEHLKTLPIPRSSSSESSGLSDNSSDDSSGDTQSGEDDPSKPQDREQMDGRKWHSSCQRQRTQESLSAKDLCAVRELLRCYSRRRSRSASMSSWSSTSPASLEMASSPSSATSSCTYSPYRE